MERLPEHAGPRALSVGPAVIDAFFRTMPARGSGAERRLMDDLTATLRAGSEAPLEVLLTAAIVGLSPEMLAAFGAVERWVDSEPAAPPAGSEVEVAGRVAAVLAGYLGYVSAIIRACERLNMPAAGNDPSFVAGEIDREWSKLMKRPADGQARLLRLLRVERARREGRVVAVYPPDLYSPFLGLAGTPGGADADECEALREWGMEPPAWPAAGGPPS